MTTIDIFILKKEHLKLLQRAYVRWEDCEFGAPAIDCKRPYGNSSVFQDIAEILEIEYPEEPSREYMDALNRLHAETQIALQIILQTQAFKLGKYKQVSFKWEYVEFSL